LRIEHDRRAHVGSAINKRRALAGRCRDDLNGGATVQLICSSGSLGWLRAALAAVARRKVARPKNRLFSR
jgi:hypothetical protein